MPIIGNITPTNVNIDPQPISVTETNPITVPAPNAPSSSFIRTIPYVIPAGYYAVITPMGSWMTTIGGTLGLKDLEFNFNSSGNSGPEELNLHSNLLEHDVYVQSNWVNTGIFAVGDYIRFITVNNANPTTNIVQEQGSVPFTDPTVADVPSGLNEFSHIHTEGQTPIYNNHIFRLPPQHTLRREWRHFGGGDIVTKTKVWSQEILKGSFSVPAGQTVDGARFNVDLFAL